MFATRRGGSTLLRDVIYSQSEFNYISQPFNHYQFNPYMRFMPEGKIGQLISLQETDKRELKQYIDRLLERKYIVRSQWKIWAKNYHWRWERYVLKILAAKAMIDWFTDTYRETARIVYMTRHPIPSALSIIHKKFRFTAKAYLCNEHFVKSELTDDLINFAYQILDSGTTLEKYVLNWCLENLVPLRRWEYRGWVTVSFERLVLEQRHTAARLCEKLDLTDIDRMIETISRPSPTTTRASKSSILAMGPQERVSYWIKGIDEDILQKVAKILEAFQIDLYDAGDPLPKAKFDEF